MASLKERYRTDVLAKLQQELGEKNPMVLPRVQKVVCNVGAGRAPTDEKFLEEAMETLTRVSGQRPVRTLARKSIAAFKIREGVPIGTMVTLRGARMWDFLEKLIDVTLPRVRDFRGISDRAVDRQGNLSIGFTEHVAFPEVATDAVDRLHGLQVTIVTNAGTRERGLALFRAMGFPFQQSTQ